MIREVVTISDFKKISSENHIFIWHFLQKKQNEVPYTIQSYFEDLDNIYNGRNSLLPILESIDIPYFESFNHESIDFLMDLGFSGPFLYNPKPNVFGADHFKHYTPLIIGFKDGKMINSTVNTCYCMEGILEVIASLDIKLLETLDI